MPSPIPSNGTLLVLTPLSGFASIQLTPYAARGLTQTMEVIGQGEWLRRDVNGSLRNVADTRFRKYKSTISCRDGETPCLDNAWIGETCLVSCAFEFSFPTGGFPERTPVSGSERTQGSFTYYRPELTMLVVNIKNAFNEYSAINDWAIELEEV